MNLPSMLAGLGWSSLVEDQCFSFCPEAVRMFYVSIKRWPCPKPLFFTTVVYNHKIKVTPDLLASVLSLPHSGLQAGFDGEFHDLGFDFLPRCLFSLKIQGGGGAGGLLPAAPEASLELVPALLKADVSAIDAEVMRTKVDEPSQDGLTKASLGLLLCKERLELMQAPQGDLEDVEPAPEDFDPMSSDSGSDDDIFDYESPPKYPF
ncbi:unnamed protein product [Linum trigynum]|uniref:Uncharacterized protein n=1 Tax=Linum trigynum TaxID=586398 RepID=A0AAV2EC29_9ROSI